LNDANTQAAKVVKQLLSEKTDEEAFQAAEAEYDANGDLWRERMVDDGRASDPRAFTREEVVEFIADHGGDLD